MCTAQALRHPRGDGATLYRMRRWTRATDAGHDVRAMPDGDERRTTRRICGATERVFGCYGPFCTLDPEHEDDHEAHDETKALDDPRRIVSVWPRGAED